MCMDGSRACLGEGDGALDALGALNDGALADLLLLQQLLVDGMQQRLLRDLRIRALQRLRAGDGRLPSGTAPASARSVTGVSAKVATSLK